MKIVAVLTMDAAVCAGADEDDDDDDDEDDVPRCLDCCSKR